MSEKEVKIFVARAKDGAYFVMVKGLPDELIFGGPHVSRRAAEKEARQLCFYPAQTTFDPKGGPS